jgi:hypothetical protein
LARHDHSGHSRVGAEAGPKRTIWNSRAIPEWRAERRYGAASNRRGLRQEESQPCCECISYTYHATAMEYLVGLFLIGVGMTIYFVGRQVSKAVAARTA